MELFFPGEAKKFYFVKALDVNVSQNRKKEFFFGIIYSKFG